MELKQNNSKNIYLLTINVTTGMWILTIKSKFDGLSIMFDSDFFEAGCKSTTVHQLACHDQFWNKQKITRHNKYH